MKVMIAICFFAFAAVALARPNEGEVTKYTNKYDNVDLLEILGNERLFSGYMKCLLDEGKCPPDAKELKGNMKDALENHCAKCTKVQKEGAEHVISHLINHKPDHWALLTAKYDPDNKYAKKYEEELKKVKA